MLKHKLIRLSVTAAIATICTMASAGALYTGSTNATNLNIRASNNTDAAILTSLPRGTKFAVLNANTDWYKVAYDGIVGYASGKYVTRVENEDIKVGTGIVSSDTGVNVRKDNEETQEIVARLEYGASVSVIGVKGDWFKVKTGDVVGYIRNDLLSITSSSSGSSTSRSTSSTADVLRSKIVSFAKKFLGTPYRYGGSSPKGFDCSGFTSYVYKNVVRSIPRTSASQYSSLTNVKKADLLPGDLVFFGSKKKVSHVGIYIGNGKFIHSPQTGDVIRIQSLSSRSNYVGAARVIFD